MSEENDDAQNGEGEGIKSLRKEFEALKKQLSAVQEENAGLKAEKRSRSVSEVLKAKGLPEKAASLYSGDDASEEAVGKWIEEFGDVFGLKPNEQAPNPQEQQIQRVQEAAFGQPNFTTDTVPANGQLIGDPVELLAQMKSLSYEQAVEQGLLPDVKGTLYDTHNR